MKPILIQEIPKNKQFYDTCGNYGRSKTNDWILVSKEKGYIESEEEVMGVALHELVEFWLCLKRGIKLKDIDKWDLSYRGNGEPGEVKGCPYFREHKFANKLERLFVKELND
jgi:hypothetical protein